MKTHTTRWKFAYWSEIAYGATLFLSYLLRVTICSVYPLVEFYIRRAHILVELFMMWLVWHANFETDSTREVVAYILHLLNSLIIILQWSSISVHFGDEGKMRSGSDGQGYSESSTSIYD